MRRQRIEWVRAAIAAETDPESPDFMIINQASQPVVDATFLAQAVLCAPTELWQKLGSKTPFNPVKALQSTRSIRPGLNNWLLFSAMVEARLCFMGRWWNRMRVDDALREHQSWYLGDGMYGAGPRFHCDHYNSYVTQPMLLDVLDTVSKHSRDWDSMRRVVLARAQRYVAIQERLISVEGTSPVIGGSLVYGFWAFHLLASVALRRQLPEGILLEQVRCVLTTVMRGMIEAPGTYPQLEDMIFPGAVVISVRPLGFLWVFRGTLLSGGTRHSRGPNRRSGAAGTSRPTTPWAKLAAFPAAGRNVPADIHSKGSADAMCFAMSAKSQCAWGRRR